MTGVTKPSQCPDCNERFGTLWDLKLHKKFGDCGRDPSMGDYLIQDDEGVWRRPQKL